MDKIVLLLNIRALINISYTGNDVSLKEYWSNKLAQYDSRTTLIDAGFYESTIAVIPEWNLQFLSTDFWKHGQAGIIDIADDIYPTYWYGKEHPFEFEFVVNDNIHLHKIFDNLEIISNNAEPESFHYEIIGDSYSFSNNKSAMYIRLEKTKKLFLDNGVDITYDRNYVNLFPTYNEVYSDTGKEIILHLSTILPTYYCRKDTINEIEDQYYLKEGQSRDFSNRSGGEILRYDTLDEYRIVNHSKAIDITKKGRLRGNMQYLEDRWKVLISPLNIFLFKEEFDKKVENLDSNDIKVVLNYEYIPEKIVEKNLITVLPDELLIIDYSQNKMKEVPLKDKWIKVKIRYSGKKLTIILQVKMVYRISYS